MLTVDEFLDDLFSVIEIPEAFNQFKIEDPVEFLETFVYDPERGELLVLEDEQKQVIREMTRRDENGLFVYDTLVYSAIKKSGKTTICAGLVLWQSCWVDRGNSYIVGNDLKQADSRMFRVIEYTVKHHVAFKELAKVVRYKVELANGTVIEAVPVDPAGEAGNNPICIAWTETWGARHAKHKQMWTEMALSPTRMGQGFILVESYAGYEGESEILENLFHNKGEFLKEDIELYANGKQLTYWCTRRAMPWQRDNPEYYASESKKLSPNEFRRVHGNEWVSSEEQFIHEFQWAACRGDLPSLQPFEQCIVGMDAGVVNDCFAVVVVSRRGEMIYLRDYMIWTPPKNGELDYAEIERFLWNEETGNGLFQRYPVGCVVYDPYQLHDMAGRLQTKATVWFEKFSQGQPRLIADRNLQRRIIEGRFRHNDNDQLTAHILNANAKTDGDKLRIVKKADSRKIDAAVALSMACEQAAFLNIG